MEESKEIDVKDSDEFLTALYLFDETELQHCKQENLDQKQVSALVYIDNYDEALDSIEDVEAFASDCACRSKSEPVFLKDGRACPQNRKRQVFCSI